MKTLKFAVLVLAIGVLFFGSAKDISAGQWRHSRSSNGTYANSLADGGRIRLKHSPVLGFNITIAIKIDGVQAGAFAKGHVYQRYLTPGQHTIYARRNGAGRESESWNGTLDVRRGETYSFVVKATPNQVILQPASEVH
jgi:hypothetical protein